LSVPDVDEKIDKVEYYAIKEETDLFILKTKDAAIEGLNTKELMAHVRERMRGKKGADIKNGDYDTACKQFHKMLTNYPHRST